MWPNSPLNLRKLKMPDERIMILEDEAIIAWDIEAELQSRGMTVVGVVGHVAEAQALVEAGDITIAILDINVGSENSYGIAHLCREKGIAVIFLTGETGDERPEGLKDCPITSKPVNYNQLMDALRQIGA